MTRLVLIFFMSLSLLSFADDNEGTDNQDGKFGKFVTGTLFPLVGAAAGAIAGRLGIGGTGGTVAGGFLGDALLSGVSNAFSDGISATIQDEWDNRIKPSIERSNENNIKCIMDYGSAICNPLMMRIK